MRTSSAIEDMVVKQVQTTQQQRPSELQLYGMGNPPTGIEVINCLFGKMSETSSEERILVWFCRRTHYLSP